MAEPERVNQPDLLSLIQDALCGGAYEQFDVHTTHAEVAERVLAEAFTPLLAAKDAEIERRSMYERTYWEVQYVLNEALGTEEGDGAGAGIAADVELLAKQRAAALARVAELTRERDEALAHIERLSRVGICGHQAPLIFGATPDRCVLRHGHDGWHEADAGRPQWIEQSPSGRPVAQEAPAATTNCRCPSAVIHQADCAEFDAQVEQLVDAMDDRQSELGEETGWGDLAAAALGSLGTESSVSADQIGDPPAPRVWRKGDPEPELPIGHRVLASDGTTWALANYGGWGWFVLALGPDAGLLLWPELVEVHGPLTEVFEDGGTDGD